MLNVDELLLPVTPDAPAGANLEYSPEFAELERTAAGKPERQIGASVVAAEEPDWKALAAQASALLRSTKDLRVANHLVRALLRAQGFAGLADGLRVVRGLVERYWGTLHPRLDAEDDNDPTLRVNAMAALTHRDVLQAIRAAPLLQSKAFGAVTLREIDGAGAAPGQPPTAQAATIEAAFNQVPLADLADATAVAQACSDEARALVEAWSAQLDSAGPDFTEFRRALAQVAQILKTQLARRQPSAAEEASAADGAGAAGAVGGPAPFVRGELRSRDDVLRALDGICAYYARHEPSSPVPLLLERCKRLATMTFVDIIKDMLPDGISTIQTIAGKGKE
ncbi:MAG TPA: type VI secretion system protein TssA [Polyangiaceae bacterium]|nr:type VI secretion system protein TssA [Polyangiaceae bacterium]